MRNWPKLDTPLWERAWQVFLGKIISAASKVPRLGGAREGALHVSLRPRALANCDRTARPTDLTIIPLQITFIDLFFTEDFQRLKAGLRKMKRRYGSDWWTANRDDLDPWFRKSGQGGGGWLNVGPLSLPESPDQPTMAGDVQIHLHRVSPSIICLSLSVSPTAAFIQRFQAMISGNADPQRIVRCSSLRKWGWYVAGLLPRDVRGKELVALFLDLNREIVQILRQYVGVGWSGQGPLPSVEFFVLDNGEHTADTPEERGFWESMEMPTQYPYVYRRNGLTLFPKDPWGRARSEISRYRILVDSKVFLSGHDLTSYGTRESALNMILHDAISTYHVVIALQEHIQRLAGEVSRMREDLAPTLADRRIVGRWFVWRRAFRRVVRLNNLVFENKRLRAEIKLEKLDQHLARDLRGFQRDRFGDKDTGELVDDLNWQLTRTLAYTEAQLEVLRENYHDRLNFSLQSVFFWLARVGLLLAIVGLLLAVPEDVRKLVFGWLRSVLPGGSA